MLNGNDCEEIYEFLSYMNKFDVMQIPENILKYLKNKRNKKFNTKIDKNDLFNFDNISENSLNFLIYIDKIYWQKINEKTLNIQEKNNLEMPQNSINLELVEYKESFFTKFKNVIFKILHINK